MTINTPSANKADHNVDAQDELHEREASCTSVFCNDMLLQKSLASSTI